MNNEQANQLKSLVREKYAEIAHQSYNQNAGSCCGATCGCNPVDYSIMAEDYSAINGYVADADLGLGCGLPTEFADIKPGDIVVDLGSGAGNDAFVARALTGQSGKVIGVDFTEAMIEKARSNAAQLGYPNVEFRAGDIENIPVEDNSVDVVVSNCVFNLVPDKVRAFAETFRILKPGGHFSISDIVLRGTLPVALRKSAEMYAGCVAGAVSKSEYLKIIEDCGFVNIKVQKEKLIILPDEVLRLHLKAEEMLTFLSGESGIYSITVYAEKPADL